MNAHLTVLATTFAMIAVAHAAPSQPLLRLRAATFDPAAQTPQFPASLRFADDAGAPGRDAQRAYILQFRDTVSRRDAASIEAAGGRVHAYVPDNALLATLSPAGALALRGGPRLRWMGRLEPAFRLAPGLLGTSPRRVTITLFAGASPEAFRKRLRRLPGGDQASATTTSQLRGTPSPTLGTFVDLDRDSGFSDTDLAALAHLEEVAFIEPAQVITPINDDTIWVGQSHDAIARQNYMISAPIWNQGILGTGQIAAVMDTGLDADNCFFKYDATGTAPEQFLAPPAVGTLDPTAKVVALYVQPGGDAYAGSGHGTATMGTVLGDNFASLATPVSHGHDPGDGLAPHAQLVAQVPLGIAGNLPDAFAQAYDSGARVHSNSWISGGNSYALACRQVDGFVWEREDFVGVFGAGNAGGAPNNRTVSAPSVAKNNLSVAACSPGSQNDADDLIDYSRGPAFDDRIKPDIVTPSGVSTAGSDNLPGTDNCSVGSLGGTSASTPAVAGFAVLTRQYFGDGFYPGGARNPSDAWPASAALVKATLLASATPLLGTDPATMAPVDPVPSFNQGWGRPLLDDALYFAADPRRTRVWDKRNAVGLETGERDEYTLPVAAGTPFKVMLAWTDPPAASLSAIALVHDLDLEVEDPSGQIFRGNNWVGGESVVGGSADNRNNVEAVRIALPGAGDYTLRVIGTAIPPAGVARFGDRQGYALVATFAACGTALGAPTGLGAIDQGAGGVALSWSPVAGATSYTVYRADGACGTGRDDTLLGETAATSFVDLRTVGGYGYTYRVRASDGCGEGPASMCAEAVATSACLLDPDFAGLDMARTDGTHCGVRLDWRPATSRCPGGARLSYNVYRSTLPDFLPSPTDLVAAGVGPREWVDTSVATGTTYYYVVRVEDSTRDGSGPANGGNEEANLQRRSGTASGPPAAAGTWTDDGGDSAAQFSLGGAWSVSATQNHTVAGALAYESAIDPGTTYPAASCSPITSPALSLDPGGSPMLGYWARYNLEQGWDGVVVELSSDGGMSWLDLPPTSGYPGDFSLSDGGGGNPANACLYARTHGAFSGPVGNGGLSPWTRYTSDLVAWVGQTVHIRFQLSSDSGLEYEGFFVDDIDITSVLLPGACVPCSSPLAVASTLRAVRVGSDAHFTWADVGGDGYRLLGSLERDVSRADFAIDSPDGLSGATHASAIAEPGLRFYTVRALGDCGNLGP